MKRILFVAGVLLLTVSTLTSCRDTTEKETVVKEVQVEKKVDTVTKDREGILERTAKEVDRKVNKEIDTVIQDIGDDN